jgi:hypothetical protein
MKLPSEAEKALREAEFEVLHNQAAEAYLEATLQILHAQGHGVLTYLKKTIETEDGGLYLLRLEHVQGPKINVSELKVVDEGDEMLGGDSG